MSWGLVTAFISTIVMLFCNNYYFGLQNQIEHLPIIMRQMDPNYLQNDFYVNAASGFGPRYYYSLIMGVLGRAITLPISFLLLTILTNLSISYVTYLLTYMASKDKLKATLAAILVTTSTGLTIGAAGLIRQSSLEPSLLALAISLWGLYFLQLKRVNTATLVFAIASLIQPSMTILMAIVAYTSYVLLERKGLLQAITFFLACYIIWILPNNSVLPTKELFEILVYFRNPHHLMPSQFPIASYLLLGLFTLGNLVSYLKIAKKSPITKSLGLMTTISFALLAAGYVYVEIFPLRIMIPLQTWRLVSLIRLSGIIVMSQVGTWWALLIIVITSIVNKGDLLATTLTIILLWIIFHLNYRRLVVLAITTVIALTIYIDRLSKIPYFNYFRPIITLNDTLTSEDLLEDYTRNNIPGDSIILTPPSMGRMRLRGARAIVVDFKAVPYQEEALREWYRRLMEIYGPSDKQGYRAEEDFNNNYLHISDEKLANLAVKYGAKYAVLFDKTLTNLPILYQNQDYKLVSITY